MTIKIVLKDFNGEELATHKIVTNIPYFWQDSQKQIADAISATRVNETQVHHATFSTKDRILKKMVVWEDTKKGTPLKGGYAGKNRVFATMAILFMLIASLSAQVENIVENDLNGHKMWYVWTVNNGILEGYVTHEKPVNHVKNNKKPSKVYSSNRGKYSAKRVKRTFGYVRKPILPATQDL